MILGIHHFSLIASSEESVRFYKKLGFHEKKRIEREHDTVVILEGFDLGLEIFIDPKHPARSAPEPLGLRLISLRVDRIEDVVEPDKIQIDWYGNRYCVITDPDENKVQLCE